MAKSSKSGLAAKYGSKLDQAVTSHGGDKTDYGMITLPAGIQNGVAKLTVCKFDVYKSGPNVGEYYFMARGVVVKPKTVKVNGEDMHVEGLQTMIMEPVCDTKFSNGDVVTQEQHVEKILNEMRKLGGNDYTDGAGAEDLEELAAGLQEAGPYFRFSTTPRMNKQTNQQTGVWENWHGTKGLEEFVPEDGGDEVEDETEEEVKEAPKPKAKAGGDKAPPKTQTKTKAKQPEPEEPEETFDDGAVDLDELAKAATNDDEEAIEKLISLAVEAGYTEEEAEDADKWSDVVKMIRSPKDGDEAGDDEEKAEPSEGDTVEYEVEYKNPKTKKTAKKVIECEVVKVNKKKQTVTLKSLDGEETEYENVGFDELK
jgi:hypothetical protein